MSQPSRLELSQFTAPRLSSSLWQLVNTLPPLFAMWWLMAATTHVSWALTWLLAVPTTGLMARAMLIQHDCGHRSFFRSKTANDVLGSLLGILSWTPYGYWQRTHALHHVNSSRLEGRDELGSLMTLTVREYQDLSPTKKWLYRVYRNPLFLCGVGGVLQFMVKHRFPWDMPRSWRREWLSVAFTNVGLVVAGLSLAHFWGWATVLRVELPLMAMSAFVAVWLIYIQHIFPDGYFASGAAWNIEEASIRGSSYYLLPRVLAWCTVNVGLHHVHHYSTKIPNYRLQECFDATPQFNVKPLTLRSSLDCWALKLWDDEAHAFVGLPDDAPAASRANPSSAA